MRVCVLPHIPATPPSQIELETVLVRRTGITLKNITIYNPVYPDSEKPVEWKAPFLLKLTTLEIRTAGVVSE